MGEYAAASLSQPAALHIALLAGSVFGAGALVIGAGQLAGRPGAQRLWRLWLFELLVVGAVLVPALAGRAAWLVFTAALAYLCTVELLRTMATVRPRSLVWLLVVIFPVAGATALAAAGWVWGGAAVIWLFAVVEVTDSFALVAGRLAGRIRPFPRLSPGKTLEGAVAGLLAGAAAGALFAPLLPAAGDVAYAPAAPAAATGALAGLVLAILTQAGDLAASAMKRRAGVKDFGAAVPMHGGVLDVYDSFLFTAPAFVLALAWLSRAAAG